MNQNDNIVFYQTSNGTYHTASTQEQIFETTNIQLPVTASTINEATHQYQELFKGNILKAEPLQKINIINANDLIQSNNVIHNVVQSDVETDNILPLRRLIRVSSINTKGKGFQLITDHVPDAPTMQPKTSIVKTLNMNGTITRTVLLPQKTYTTTQRDTSDSIISGQYIVRHNDMTTIKPKSSVIGADNSYLVQDESNGVTVQLMDTLQPNGKILVQRIRRKNIKLKNATQVKSVNTNGVGFKVPISTVTPVPLTIKPVKKILVQPETLDLIGVEQLQNGQLHVVTDSGNAVPVNIETQKNVIYNQTQPKTRIIFKVVQPEDFQLYSPAEKEETKKVKVNIKPKPSLVVEKPTIPGKTVTRSGRQVRLPKHITATYDNLDGNDFLEDALNADISSASKSSSLPSTSAASSIMTSGDKETIEPAIKEDAIKAMTVEEAKKVNVLDKALLRKKRIRCLQCKKVYSGIQCMGKHLSTFPDHATTERLNLILQKYQAQPKFRDIAPKPMKVNPVKVEQKLPINGQTATLPQTINGNTTIRQENNINSCLGDLESKEERNIFVSLVSIVEKTSDECKASVFVRQLSALILKLKRLMPCLLYEDKSSSSCMINESVGKMLEVTPGKYRLNMNAIKCLGEQGGNCPHIPPKPVAVPSSWLTAEQNMADKISSPSTLITNGSCNNDLNKWKQTVKKNKNKDQTNEKIHKWPSTNNGNDHASDELHNWSTTVNGNNQSGNDSHKWPSAINGSDHTNDEMHKWSTTVNGNNQNGNELHKWKSTVNNNKKDQSNGNVHNWSSTNGSEQNDAKLGNWSPTINGSEQNNTKSNNWSSAINGSEQHNTKSNNWSSTIDSNAQNNTKLNNWASTINGSEKSDTTLNNWRSNIDPTNDRTSKRHDKWPSTANGQNNEEDFNVWSSSGINVEDQNSELQTWSSNVTSTDQNNGKLHKWSTPNRDENDGKLQTWPSTITSNEKNCEKLHEWSSAMNNTNQNGDKLNNWPSAVNGGAQNGDKLHNWPPTINNVVKQNGDKKHDWPPTINSGDRNGDNMHNWPSTINGSDHNGDKLHNWPSTINNSDQNGEKLHNWPSKINGSGSQSGDKLHNWSLTTTNETDQNVDKLHNWPTTINNSDQNGDKLHNWPSTINDRDQNGDKINNWSSSINSNRKRNALPKRKSPVKNKKKNKNNSTQKWTPTSNGVQNESDAQKWDTITDNSHNANIVSQTNKWTPISNNGCESESNLNKWTPANDSQENATWTTSSNVNCTVDSDLQWRSTTENACQDKGDWKTNSCQEKDEVDNWNSNVKNTQNKTEWTSTIDNEEKDINKWPSTSNNVCQGKEELDKWTSTKNNGKRKWIPIGTRDPDDNSNTNDENWLSSNSDLLIDNATFPQTVDNIKRWDPLKKKSRLEDCTPRSPWQANIPELNKIDLPQEIIRPPDHMTTSSQPVPSDDSLTFDCSTKMVEDIHSNLVFDINKDISLDSDVDLKKKPMEPENFDFNDSRFDMQIDSDKLNFRSAQYNEMKYGPDTLPPFSKIEPPKNLQLPVDSLSDISSDGDKLRLPSADGILSELGSESLGLTISNEHIEPLESIEARKDVTLNQSENAVHCDDQSLLNSSDLNLPISSANTLSRNESILSVSESSLDGARLNLSSSLNLLDSLGPDCLSFTDSDLRTTSQMSLDLQDLFPFHHS